MKLLSSIFITCSLLAFSCNLQNDPDTEALGQYLSANFSLQINDTAIYCFIPANQCQSCFRYDGSQLSPAMNKRLVVISGFPASNFLHFDHVYADKANAMLKLRLLNYGNRLVICRNHHIQSSVSITDLYGQLDSLERAMAAQRP